MRIRSILAATSLSLLPVVVATSAHAAGQDGVVNSGEMIFYYSANFTGSYSDFSASRTDLTGYTFLKAGASGYGQAVRNNAASVDNRRNQAARVYYSINYAGVSDYVDPLGARNLAATSNDNASFRWI